MARQDEYGDPLESIRDALNDLKDMVQQAMGGEEGGTPLEGGEGEEQPEGPEQPYQPGFEHQPPELAPRGSAVGGYEGERSTGRNLFEYTPPSFTPPQFQAPNVSFPAFEPAGTSPAGRPLVAVTPGSYTPPTFSGPNVRFPSLDPYTLQPRGYSIPGVEGQAGIGSAGYDPSRPGRPNYPSYAASPAGPTSGGGEEGYAPGFEQYPHVPLNIPTTREAAPSKVAQSKVAQPPDNLGGFDPNNPADVEWYRQFMREHQGMRPEEYYSQPNNAKPNMSPMQAAMADRAWGDAYARNTGRAPTYGDWVEHYNAQRVPGYTPHYGAGGPTGGGGPTGYQPTGTQPTGTHPTGTQPTGTQPTAGTRWQLLDLYGNEPQHWVDQYGVSSLLRSRYPQSHAGLPPLRSTNPLDRYVLYDPLTGNFKKAGFTDINPGALSTDIGAEGTPTSPVGTPLPTSIIPPPGWQDSNPGAPPTPTYP